MIGSIITILILLGSALMVYNIMGFIRYARYVSKLDDWSESNGMLILPVVLLVFFLIGYLVIGLLGKPDLLMAGILFGGSIFVFVMYRTLWNVTQGVLEAERLRSELQIAEESNRAKTSFLASMSHEMRTPLNVIIGLDTIALKDDSLSDDVRGDLEKIGYSAQHLLTIINNALDMNQLESGELVIRKEEFSLKEMIYQLNSITQNMCMQAGLAYNVELNCDLEYCYIGDVSHMRQILISILDNAVKYTDPPGNVWFTAENFTRDGSSWLRFIIRDDGVGMSEEFLPKVFDVFVQEDASFTQQHGGSGLGLAVALKIAELMGGTITAESRKGVGSTFTVELPVEISSSRDGRREAAEGAAPDDFAESLEGCRILIVEDIDVNAEIVADLLELEGAESERAENGQIAVDMIRESEDGYYDAVLMDLRMPVMDGFESTRQIRALGRDYTERIPILALTANAYEEDVKKALDAGMNEHLAKPADADFLFEMLRKHISGQTRGDKA